VVVVSHNAGHGNLIAPGQAFYGFGVDFDDHF
jgi:hypothetical protein